MSRTNVKTRRSRSSGARFAVVATLAVFLLQSKSGAEDTNGWPAWPTAPADLTAEGNCGGSCEQILSLTYSKLREAQMGKCVYHNPPGTEHSVDIPERAMFTYWPTALCSDGGYNQSPNGHWQPCPCRFENCIVFWASYGRDVTRVQKIYATKVTTTTVSVPGKLGGEYSVRRIDHVYKGEAPDPGPWTCEGSGRYSVNCCVCTHDDKGTYLPRGWDPIPPVKNGTPSPVTTDDGNLPSDVDKPGNWPMPTRCTNSQCFAEGTVKYTSALSSSSQPVTESVWNPTGGKYGNGWDQNSAGEWVPVMTGEATHQAWTGLTATWTVTVPPEVKCTTAHGPGTGQSSAGHANPTGTCVTGGTCEFESIPQGTATRTWSRGYWTVPVFEKMSPPGKLNSFGLASQTNEQDVKTDFTIHYVTPWTQGTATGWSGQPVSRCKCVSPVTTGSGYIDWEHDHLEKLKKKEEEKRDTKPPPVTTPK